MVLLPGSKLTAKITVFPARKWSSGMHSMFTWLFSTMCLSNIPVSRNRKSLIGVMKPENSDHNKNVGIIQVGIKWILKGVHTLKSVNDENVGPLPVVHAWCVDVAAGHYKKSYTPFTEKCRSASNRNLKLARDWDIHAPWWLLACIVMAMGHGSGLV